MKVLELRPPDGAESSKSSRFYIPSLDGLRVLALSLVFTSHAGLDNIVPGGFGVTTFFFLSGYLITTLLRREYEQTQTINLKNFYMRRMLRIWPPLYLVLLLAIAVAHVINPVVTFTIQQQIMAFLAQAAHLANYYIIGFGNAGMAPGTEVYWSLAVEEHFYLLFPLLYMFLLKLGVKPSKQFGLFLGICLLVLLWRCVLVFGLGADSERIFCGTDTRADSILFGCALAVYGNPMLDRDNQVSEGKLKYFLFPLGLALLVLTLLYKADSFRDTLRYTIQGIALYPIFLTVIRFPQWGLLQVLNYKWVKFGGVLSYSMYLVHFTVIKSLWAALPGMGRLPAGILAFGISLLLAYTIYQLVEIPAGKLKARFSNHAKDATH